MQEMEDGVRIVKKKTSSGCLIIKRKVDGNGGIVGASGAKKVFESNTERKRQRLVRSDSESSDDGESLEPFRMRVDSEAGRFHNGSVAFHEGGVGDNKYGRNGDIGREGKRRLDVSDDYDCNDGKRMRKDCFPERFRLAGCNGSERTFETESIRHAMMDKQNHSYFDSANNNLSGGRNEVPGYYNVKSRFEKEGDEAHRPITALRQKYQVLSDKPIRVQGKNGVLKVMVNRMNKMGMSHRFYDDQLGIADRKGENAVKKNMHAGHSVYADSKRPEKALSVVRTEKHALKLEKPCSASAATNSESEDSDTSLRLGPTSVQARSSLKGIKSEEKAPSAENIAPAEEKEGEVKYGYGTEKQKEGKVKRGNGTEKQLLRDKIRHMLVSAGWTIDYRPRKNRDYLDAVYINPTGTAYWSIIKAYEAFQKQLDEKHVVTKPRSQFTPVPGELLSKLTRRTRKKIEKEMKMNQRGNSRSKNGKGIAIEESVKGTDGNEKLDYEEKDNGDEKLSLVMMRSDKSPKGRSHETTCASGDDSSGTLSRGSPKQEKAEKPSTATNTCIIQGKLCQNMGRCRLLIRSSDKGLNSETDGYVPYMGKRTLLSWLIDSGVVHLSEKVQYMNRKRTRVVLEGWITRDGIHCGCCSKILSVSKFEIHAGSKLRQPFQNIYLESGVSLLQCQIDAWNRQEESKRRGFHTVYVDGDDPNDDICGLCGDGGDLICCDGCPSTFHQSCLDIKTLPHGHWHCPNCTCKFCGITGGSRTQRNGTTVSALQTCSLCEKKYHEFCSQEIDALPDDSNHSSTSFCGQECQKLFDDLQKLLGVKHELEAGFSWSLHHRTDLDTDTSHRSFPQRVECNSKLAVALPVMDECFLPIVDRSGVNLVHNVLYNCGSNFSRLNYTGFYTAILETGDEIISAASIRIHGAQLAELPFIGTRQIYRRQGMCRLLYHAIESALCSLKVKKLIVPAPAEHMHTLVGQCGFNPLEESHKQEMRSINILVFPGTDMLQKLLVDQKNTSDSGAKSVLIQDNHGLVPELGKKSDVDSSAGHDLNIYDDCSLHNVNRVSDKAAAVDSSLQVPTILSDDNACLNISVHVPCESNLPVLCDDKTLDSKSVEILTESSTDLKCPPSSDANCVHLEMEHSELLDPSVNGKSSAVGLVDGMHEANVKVTVIEPGLDSSDETSIANTAEDIKGDQKFLCFSTVNGTDEMQLNADLNPNSAVNMECKVHFTSEVPSEAKVEPVEGSVKSSAGGYNDDTNHAKDRVSCAGAVLGSAVGTSAPNMGEKVIENVDPVSVFSPLVTDECVVQPTSNYNKTDALAMESKLNAASQFSDAEIAYDARVASAEGNVQSSSATESDDAFKVACVKPVLDSFGSISGQNVIEEMNESLNHILPPSIFVVESEISVASEVSSTPVWTSIQSSAAGDTNDAHES